MKVRKVTFFVFLTGVFIIFCADTLAVPPTWTISGIVETAAGTAVEGVDVVGDNGATSTVTGVNGAYSITVPNHWDGTIAVSKTGWLITPASNTYTNVNADIAGEDYTAYQPSISGYVRKADGSPLEGVNVTADNGGGSDTTDASGYYEIVVPYEWSGSIDATLLYWFFAPDKISYTNVTIEHVEQNYIGSYKGSGTEEDPFLIENLTDFDIFSDTGNAALYWADGAHTKLMIDINLAGRSSAQAVIAPDMSASSGFNGTPYSGVFDGNGFKIINLSVDAAGTNNDYLGLFGYLASTSQILNLGLENVSVTSGSYSECIGGLAGYNGGMICECYKNGSVWSGGGYSENFGGIVGYNEGDIVDSYSMGTVHIYAYEVDYVGGLAGRNSGQIIRCYNTGSVYATGVMYAGGLVGFNFGALIQNCYNHGYVEGDNRIGGIAGDSSVSSIENCYNTGDVSGHIYVGGIAADVWEGRIINCYSAGDVYASSSTNDAGGIVVLNSGTDVISCFWDTQVSGITTSRGGTGLPTDAMQTKDTYLTAGWDFVNTWGICENQTYPGLYIEDLRAFDLSSNQFIFTALFEHPDPNSQTLSINNSFYGDIIWEISTNDVNCLGKWLLVNPVAGTTTHDGNDIEIRVDTTGLYPGIYNCTLVLSGVNVLNNPQMLDVQLEILGPSLSVSQNEFYFQASKETLIPSPQTLTIANLTGGGTLNWSIVPDCNWLILEPQAGVINEGSLDVDLDIDLNKVDYGMHICHLMVEAIDAENSPQTVTVILDVLPPEIGVAPVPISFECDLNEPDTFTQVLTISNTGYDKLNWLIVNDCNWLSIEPVSGQCVSGPNEVTLMVDAELDVGFYNCEFTVTDENASNSPVTVPVSLHVYRDGELHVPMEYPTIQQAINAAVNGDHVIIHPGRYNYLWGGIDYKGKAITVRSIDPTNPEIVAFTILDGYVRFDNGEGRSSVLDGLTLYGSVVCYNSSPVIRNCVLSSSAPYAYDHGLISTYAGNPYIQNCTFVGIQLSKEGSSAIIIEGNRDTMDDTIIENCLISLKYGYSYPYFQMSSIQVRFGHADVINTTIAYCVPNIDESYPYISTGTALSILESDVSLKDSIIWGNRGSDNRQVAIINHSSSFADSQNSHLKVDYSLIEDESESILIFPDYTAFNNYWRNGIFPDPNLIDPNTLIWGTGNIDADPLFVREPNDGGDGWFPISIPGAPLFDYSPINNNDYGDLHLKSEGGRFVWDGFARADFNFDKQVNLVDFTWIAQWWNKDIHNYPAYYYLDIDGDYRVNEIELLAFLNDYLQPRTFGAWVTDDVTSPCIDAGDPNDMDWQNELWPHGGRINMGAYGGTPQASLSLNTVGNPADLNHDDAVDYADWNLWSDDWLGERVLLDSDFDRNNVVDPNDLNVFLDNWLWQGD